MGVKVLLTKEIESEISSLEDLEFGSDTYKVAVDGVTKLLDKLNEMERTEFEYQDKYESRTSDVDLKLKEMEEEKQDRFTKNCLTGISVVGGFALTVWGTYKSLKFEETGSITSTMGRGFISKLLPKK